MPANQLVVRTTLASGRAVPLPKRYVHLWELVGRPGTRAKGEAKCQPRVERVCERSLGHARQKMTSAPNGVKQPNGIIEDVSPIAGLMPERLRKPRAVLAASLFPGLPCGAPSALIARDISKLRPDVAS
jgi:hypothetical protein